MTWLGGDLETHLLSKLEEKSELWWEVESGIKMTILRTKIGLSGGIKKLRYRLHAINIHIQDNERRLCRANCKILSLGNGFR
jgi:hypothetical protein